MQFKRLLPPGADSSWVLARSDYHQLGMPLLERGFMEDQRPGAPLCHWRFGDVDLNLMPYPWRHPRLFESLLSPGSWR